jgi:murein DD-endopeptidase MepM/ murein hydrolase activator NlpD
MLEGILPTRAPTSEPPTPVRTAAFTDDEADCGAPADWPAYVVQIGDTLFSIARAVNSSVGELRDANCLNNVNSINAGDELFVPRLPEGPVQTGIPALTPIGEPESMVSASGCSLPTVGIVAPTPGQQLGGTFELRGTANIEDFQYFNIEVRADNATTYNHYKRVETPVANGLLGQVDTSIFGDGLHWVRIVVVDQTGNVQRGATCAIPLLFE